MQKFIFFLVLLVLLSSSVSALDNTQQYSKIFLNPFYRVSMVGGTNYTYNIAINPPDKIGSVINAIMSFNAQINGQTQTFSLWVNKQSCNPASYSVATAYSATGNIQFYFDCSQQIDKVGFYNVTLQSAVVTGAITGWLDLTYMTNATDYVAGVGLVNKCTAVDNVSQVNSVNSVDSVISVDSVKKIDKPEMDIFGTEYIEGDDATIFLQLRDSDGAPIENATCVVDIYYPNLPNQVHPEWIDNGLMRYKEEGLYFYDFIVPFATGLYMVNAQCSYISQNNYYYTLASGYSPPRNVTTGTYVGDTFVLDDYGEWLYTQCDSGPAGGGTKQCDSWYEWNLSRGISGELGNVTEMFVSYLGENNGANLMTMYYLNWTNLAWIALPNTLTFKATASSGVPIGVDEYLSNKIPLSNHSLKNSLVRVRIMTTSGSTFKQWDNWLTIKTSQYVSTIQEVKGSGEVHVSSLPAGTNRYFRVDTCDGYTDGRCGFFTNDGEFDLAEGELEHYFNFTATSTKQNNDINFNTPFTVDCSAIYWIKEYNGTDWVDFTDYEVYSQPASENCIITLFKDITSGTQYSFWIKEDNYMKWEVDYTKRISDDVNQSVYRLCANRNFTYVNPITESSVMPTDYITNMCYQFYDDQYWIDSYYQDSLGVGLAGEYASYVQEMRFYRRELYDRYSWLKLENNLTTSIGYDSLGQVWSYPNRTVSNNQNWIGGTEYSSTESTGRIVSRILDNAGTPVNGASCNLTIILPIGINVYLSSIMSIPPTQVNGIYYYDFNHSGQIGVHTYLIDCNKLGQRYFLMGTYHVFDNTGVAGQIWGYPIRNLTYYPASTNISNFEDMVSQIWSSTANRTLSEQGFLWVGGTEYNTNETTGKIIIRMVNSNGIPVTGGTCVGTIMYPNMSIYSNLTLTEITTRAGMYYVDFAVPKTLGVYPYGIDCTQGGKNYYLADTIHIRDVGSEVWSIHTPRNLTYYEDKTNYTKVAENVWNWNGSIVTNILDKIAAAVWEFMGGKAEIIT